jgi:pyrophosphatase PpaX
MKEYTCYLFDADGTLFDTQEMIFQCFKNTFAVFGRPEPSRELIIGTTGIPLRTQVDRFFSPTSDDERDVIIKVHTDYQASIYRDYLRTFPHAVEVLETLHRMGKKLAVVTSRKLDTLVPYLGETGLGDFFTVLISPESTRNHKPHPEPAIAALTELAGTASESLFIGDSLWDMECGRRAGTDTAFVGWSGVDASTFPESPTWTIDDYHDLLAW